MKAGCTSMNKSGPIRRKTQALYLGIFDLEVGVRRDRRNTSFAQELEEDWPHHFAGGTADRRCAAHQVAHRKRHAA